ncbi:MAG: hypothetical protein Q27BPR15_07785 [Rhodobacter sp. CACIA14H1]|nr:MAG: hypothetical protein Q27BPR15_07785 [Rhodobacter sp. CACIA14H1]
MGISTPKPPFNLAEFLATPASPKQRRKPTWHRRPAAATEVEQDEDTTETPPRA